MFFKHVNPAFTLSLLFVALLFAVACDRTPDAAPETPEPAQPTVIEAPKVSEIDKSFIKPVESVQVTAAALRDQFTQEASTSINIDNAESVLAGIEKELNDELAELKKQTPPISAN